MKVLIVEDDPVTIDTISLVFELQWPEVKVIPATKGSRGIDLAREESPDVVILDLSLPDVDGMDVLRRIREFATMPVIILTGRIHQSDIIRGLESGADDYVTKPFDPAVLIARVRTVLRRIRTPGSAEDTGTVVSGDLVIDFSLRQVTRAGRPVVLTAMEWGLLTHLAQNEGRVVTYKELWDKVWGSKFIDDISALRTAIWRLRTKLGDEGNSPGIITSYRGTGYCFKVPG